MRAHAFVAIHQESNPGPAAIAMVCFSIAGAPDAKRSARMVTGPAGVALSLTNHQAMGAAVAGALRVLLARGCDDGWVWCNMSSWIDAWNARRMNPIAPVPEWLAEAWGLVSADKRTVRYLPNIVESAHLKRAQADAAYAFKAWQNPQPAAPPAAPGGGL